MTRPVRCPMRVPVAGGIACRALAAVWSGAARRVCGHAPDIARFALAPQDSLVRQKCHKNPMTEGRLSYETRSAQPSDALTREPAWGSRLSSTSTMSPVLTNHLLRRSIRRVRDGPQWSLSRVESCLMILVDGVIVDRVAVSVAVSSSIMKRTKRRVRNHSHSVGHSPQSCVADPGLSSERRITR
jgi:hypothetical protein